MLETSSSPIHYELSLPGTLPEDATPANGRAAHTQGAQRGADAVEAVANGDARSGGPTVTSGVSGAAHGVASMDIQQEPLIPPPPSEFTHPISIGRRRWMVFLFCLVAALLFADQNLLAPNLTAAANYFGMDERQKDVWLGGVLNAAFFMVGAPAALLIGWMADAGKHNRRTLLFWVVCVGTTPCLLTYWVREYWQFFILRALTGVAVGGCFPLVFSLLGDLFPPSRRAAVSAVVQIATGAGLAAGQALSGALGPATNWRLPFVLVAAPSLGSALLMLGSTVDPPRGAYEEALRERYAEGLGAYEGRISWAAVAALLRCPSNALIIAQGLPGSLPWGMVSSYINDFLSQQKGFSVQAATLVLLFFGGGAAIGVIGGGAGGQWLYNRKKEYQALFAGASVLAGIGPLYALINADLQSLGLGASCFLAGLAGCVASVAGPNVRAVLLNVNEPERRGTALALQSTTDDVGKGLGPVMVAGLIRVMGRKGAFNISTFGWVPCGALILGLAACMRRDEAAMQARLAAASEAAAAAAEAAEAEAGGRGGGIQLPTPPMGSEGGEGPGGSGGGAGGGAPPAAAAAAAAARREERHLARVPLLGPGPASDAPPAGGTDVQLEVAAVRVKSRTGSDGGTMPLPVSTAALEPEAVAGPGPGSWGRPLGAGAGVAAGEAAGPAHAQPYYSPAPPPPPPALQPLGPVEQQPVAPQQAGPRGDAGGGGDRRGGVDGGGDSPGPVAEPLTMPSDEPANPTAAAPHLHPNPIPDPNLQPHPGPQMTGVEARRQLPAQHLPSHSGVGPPVLGPPEPSPATTPASSVAAGAGGYTGRSGLG